MYKVSVVVPVCNVGKYIEKCITSVLEQTLKEVELICIDDCSTDDSLEILRKYEQIDSRLKIIVYDTNKSASQARKDGALMAEGEYIMFLDGDDYLTSDACEKLYRIISGKKVDMVHFGTNIINEGNLPKTRIEKLEELLKPYHRVLKGNAVFEGCFVEKLYRFSIWNKIYEAKFCKKAMGYVKDGFFPKAQDLYAFLILCHEANSYYGVNEKFYNYRFGAGITGNKRMTLPQIERFCQSVYVAETMEEFLTDKDGEKYRDISNEIRKDLLNDCMQQWFNAIDDTESSQGFEIILKYWQKEEVVSLLYEKFHAKKKQVAVKVTGAKCLNYKEIDQIKTIGIFYHRYALGGVQRVISLLIPMYIELGYKVVLFTDEIDEENEYELPEGVVRVVLPHSLRLEKDEYIGRAKRFCREIEKNHVDVMCYQAGSSKMLLYDLLLVKLMGLPFVITAHEAVFQSMLTIDSIIVEKSAIYKIADRLIVLSKVEEVFWKNLGVKAVYLPNPIEHKPIERDLEKVEKNSILWVGRLDKKTKRCKDIVKIMRYVVNEIPDAKVRVVGNEFSKGLLDSMKAEIEEQGLEDNVLLCGHTTNVDEFYCKAEIHMLTSVSEGFPMTIAESKAYGLPLVMYELPFLEMCQSKKGILDAPQGNTQIMAKHIISILQNPQLKEQMQKDAHESLREFLEFDLKSAWKKVIDTLTDKSFCQVEMCADDKFSSLLYSLLLHYEYGASQDAALKKSLRKKAKQAEVVSTSLEYKVGVFVLFIPRMAYRVLKKLYKIMVARG